jgi:LmbE family N-acetylglucosaminyl deacetylase
VTAAVAASGAAADPLAAIPGPVLVIAPHSDDETLGCGGTIALLAPTRPVHVVYATDGRLSPSGPDGKAAPGADALPAIRRAEAEAAMGRLGLGSDRLRFLDLPDGRLRAHLPTLTAHLAELIRAIRPKTVLTPFRYDQHPDHLAVRRATVAALAAEGTASGEIALLEYFVYFRYPLLPERDIRRAVAADRLLAVDIEAVRTKKRAALDAYVSQATRYFPWQTRPVLTAAILDEHASGPEWFVRAAADLATSELFRRDSLLLRINLLVGPALVRWKKRVLG